MKKTLTYLLVVMALMAAAPTMRSLIRPAVTSAELATISLFGARVFAVLAELVTRVSKRAR